MSIMSLFLLFHKGHFYKLDQDRWRNTLHVVCEWSGNTEMIAAKLPLQVTDSDFERAA